MPERSWPSAAVRGVLLFSLVCGAAAVPGVARAEGTAECQGPGGMRLTRFVNHPGVPSLFYATVEGSALVATIEPSTGDCAPGSSVAQGTYRTENGVASAPQDFEERIGTTALLCGDRDTHPELCPPNLPQQEQVAVPTLADGMVEAAVEPFGFRITGATLGLEFPNVAPAYLVDGNGPTRASLEPSGTGAGAVAYARSETYEPIAIPVFLAGPMGSGSVGFSVQPSPGSSVQIGEDIQIVSPNPLPIVGRVGFIDLRIVNDDVGDPAESVDITLTAGGSAAVAAPGSTTLTILDNEENQPPSSRIHHPRNGWRYEKSDYRIREIHVFAKDNPGGAGVVGAQLAIRRNMRNGNCAWLTAKGWNGGECGARQWLNMIYEATGQLWLVQVKQLRSSVRTAVKSYTAYARAMDGAGNVERDFARKRNANTFEITPKKRQPR
jgi:hypothetical protein